MARSDGQRRALESPYGRIAEVAVKAAEPAHVATVAGEMATLEPTDGAAPEPPNETSPEPAYGASPEPAHTATAKPAGDEITSNPASHMTASPAVASASSAPRRRDVRYRSRQGDRKGKDYDPVQHRTLGSLPAWAQTLLRQPPWELQRQIHDPAVSSHGSLLLRKRRHCGNKEINLDQNKANDT